ncbi:MAG: DUF6941 family protein [Candidatus Limnocylindrales bacterium]
MRLTSAILADHASVREGLLFVSGGGISEVLAGSFPLPLPAALALVIEVQPSEFRGQTEFEIPLDVTVRARRGPTLGHLEGGVRGVIRDPTQAIRAPLAIDLRRVPITKPGTYAVAVRAGTSRASFEFRVRSQPSGEQPERADATSPT